MQDILAYIVIASAVFYIGSAVLLTLRLGSQAISLVPALLYMSLWSIFGTASVRFDFVLVAVWLAGFLFLLKTRGDLNAGISTTRLLWSLPALPLLGALFAPVLPPIFVVYLILLCMVGLLIVTENVVRTTFGSLRALGIAFGTLILFQIYFYAQTIAAGAVSAELLGARVLLNGAISLLLTLTPLYISSDRELTRRLGFSRPMAFTTTSILIAGLIIIGIALVSFVLDTQMGEYRLMMQSFFVFLCVLVVGYNLGSSSQRARIRVWINKHFFQTKHDYNLEWKKLSDRLSLATAEDYVTVALEATMAIYRATSGVLYVRQGTQFVASTMTQTHDDVQPVSEAENVDFFEKAAEGWIFVKGSTNQNIAESFNIVPDKIDTLGDFLVVIPLVQNQDLIGLIVFSPDKLHLLDFDWEDFDLLKTVAKQVSNFIAFQMLAQDNAVKQQFEAYHQFTTFVMHDLKNLVAQQELVVQNARRFKGNPEFIADAITTIESSVARMTRLMSKISNHSVLEYEEGYNSAVLLDDVISDALSKVSQRKPLPSFEGKNQELSVIANQESLTMAIMHILSNAQDACEESDQINIELKKSDSGQYAICSIKDTGSGMDPEFLENRLFKPFYSTKKTVGMGIGAYQSREIISSIGGQISVDSTPGVGSCFTVTLPLKAA